MRPIWGQPCEPQKQGPHMPLTRKAEPRSSPLSLPLRVLVESSLLTRSLYASLIPAP